MGSQPVTGVPFKLDGAQHVTPYNEVSEATIRELDAYPAVVANGRTYVFQQWDDGVKNLSRTADLSVKNSYNMIYQSQEPVQQQVQPPNYMPIIIVGLVVLGVVAICYFAYLSKR